LTICNLFSITKYLRKLGIEYKLKRSILSTLCVGLTFSIVRGMQPYLTACDYNTLNGRTDWDQKLVCTNPIHRSFSFLSDTNEISKYYNSCKIQYDDMPSLQKNNALAKRSLHSAGIMKAMRDELSEQGESTGTKKIRSHCNTSHKQIWYPCDIIACTHLPFHYAKALKSHLINIHNFGINDDELKVRKLKASIMKSILAKRSLARKKDTQELDLMSDDNDVVNTIEYIPNNQDSINYAKGDDIFPISDDIIKYAGAITTNDNEKQILISLIDCETINLFKYPEGCP
jgi:hypothetical protein